MTYEKIRQKIEKLSEIIEEIHRYLYYRSTIKDLIDRIDFSYQHKRFGYLKYKKLLDKILKGKTRQEMLDYYDSYIDFLIREFHSYNDEIFAYFYHETLEVLEKQKPKTIDRLIPKVFKHKKTYEPRPPTVKPVVKHIEKHVKKPPRPLEAEHDMFEKLPTPEKAQKKKKRFLFPNLPKLKFPKFRIHLPRLKDLHFRPPVLIFKDLIKFKFKHEEEGAAEHVKDFDYLNLGYLKKKKPAVAKPAEQHEKPLFVPKRSIFKRLKRLFAPKKKSIFLIEKEISEQETADRIEHKKPADLIFAKLPKFRIFKHKKQNITKKVIGEKTKIGKTIIELSQIKDDTLIQDVRGKSKINPFLLEHQARRIRNLLGRQKKIKVYKPSNLGALANLLTKRVSLYLLDTYPAFFRGLYNSLRSANIKTLSNTYVNIMVMFSSLAFVTTYAITAPYFFLQGAPLLFFVFGSFLFSVFTAASTFFGFYFYPKMIIKNRRKNINTNMPFAINHMSAIINSGVSPHAMFKLISESKEYEELSYELDKIVEYIEVFGYDLITAIKAVSTITPSPAFKEFLDGLISNLESGSDIKQYMSQKAQESMLNYKLERDKFLELISTFSDIYTGILIAAPLFFVIALSLVSILGGDVGGIEVNTLMAVGTYVIMPILNILFLLFLDAAQPEI